MLWICKIVANPTKHNLLQFRLIESEAVGSIMNDSFLMGQYCGTSCIGRTVPEIARNSARWHYDVSASFARAQERRSQIQQEEAQNLAAAPDQSDDDDDDNDDFDHHQSEYDDYYTHENHSIQLISDRHYEFWNSLNDSQLQAMKQAGWENIDGCRNEYWHIDASASSFSLAEATTATTAGTVQSGGATATAAAAST
jgi:hypothetical protein